MNVIRSTLNLRFSHNGLVAVEMSGEEFDQVVESALVGLPAEFTKLLDNVAITVEDQPPPECPGLLGSYYGVPLTERDSGYAGVLPDRIVIFKESILAICASRDEVISEVAVTVAHEVGHYFGIDDDHLEQLGYG